MLNASAVLAVGGELLTQRARRMSEAALIAAYVLTEIILLYFFMLQRTARLVCRSAGFHESCASAMMPVWYTLAWLPRILAWALLGAIWWTAGFGLAAVCGALAFLASALLPIPHALFFRRLHEGLWQNPSSLESGELISLASAVSRAELGLVRLSEKG